MSLTLLNQFGLSSTESQLYELLLKLGEAPVGTLIRESKLKRPTVYKALYSLEKKGMVKKQDVAKKINFKPEPPTKLLELADEHLQNAQTARRDLQGLLPNLLSSYTLSVEKPVIRMYEGVEGLKEIYKDTLAEGKKIYALLQVEEINPKLESWLYGYYLKKRAKLKIPAQVISSSGKHAKYYKKVDTEGYKTTVIVPNTSFPFKHEVDIYGDKVAFINYKKGEPLIGVVIDHPQIALTAKAWFDLAWTGAEKYNS